MPAVWTRILDTWRGLPREVWLLAIASFINRAGTMVLPFLALWLEEVHGFAKEGRGELLAIYGIGSLLGVQLGGWLTDRGGAKRVMVGSLAGTGVAILVLAQAEGLFGIGASILAFGILAESFRPANQAMLAALAPKDQLPRAFALMRLSVNAGMSIGPAIGGILAERSYGSLFLFEFCTCSCAAIWVALKIRAPERITEEPSATSATTSARGPWRDLPFVGALSLCFVSSLAFFQLYGTYPAHYREVMGFSESHIGFLFAFNTLLIVLFEMPLVARIQQRPALQTASLGVIILGLGFAMIPLLPGVSGALAVVVIYSLGEMLFGPMMGAHVGRRAPPERRGQYFGAMNVAFSAALILAPVVGFGLVKLVGPAGPWWLCLATAAYGLLALVQVARRGRTAST